MARVLYCPSCHAVYFTVSGPMRTICDCGQETVWKTVAPVPDEPRKSWAVTHNDARFLRSIRVAPD